MDNEVILREGVVDIKEFKQKMIHDDTEALVTLTEQADQERKGVQIISVEIETYGSTTRNSMGKIKDLIQKRFDIGDMVIIQGVGSFKPGETIRGVLVSASQKGEALESLAMAMDMFGPHVPIKKRVSTSDGREYWVKRADEVMNMYGQLAEGI
ncbi:MAG: molybdenum cofactor biosynthesis protein MoaE [Candidatus Thermoplasmatota archaeon]